MPATIDDVARRARVSTATVSRVLSGAAAARPETRARVLAAAADLDYRPSAIARSLKLRATRTFGLIVTDIENPFFPHLVRAVEDAARDEGYALLLCNAADDPERESGYLDLLVDRRVDGVIIAASSLGRRHRQWLADPPLPVVLVNSVARGVRLPSIASDNQAGGAIAVTHLIDLGHRRLAALTAGPRNTDAPARLIGVRRAMGRAGLDPATLVVASGEAGVIGGAAALEAALALDPAITGVVAYNDLMAIGAMRAIRASGRRVPDDVSVVGFDDVDLAAFVDPPLTTISQSIAGLGRWAIARLIERLSATPIERDIQMNAPPRVLLPVRLEVRGSTAAVAFHSAGRAEA